MSSCDPYGGRGEEQLKQMAELSNNLKEGERLLAPSHRPDGSFRNSIRIRAGYVPQDEVAIYQKVLCGGSRWWLHRRCLRVISLPWMGRLKRSRRRGMSRKKEKRLQAALEKGMNSDVTAAGERIEMIEDSNHGLESVTSLATQFDGLAVSANCADNNAPSAVIEDANSAGSGQDIDKRIITLKKKIRLAEGQPQKNGEKDLSRDQQEKLAKLEGWQQELKILDEAKAKPLAS